MSEYTTELRFMLNNWDDKKLFGNYPIFSEEYRKTLNNNIKNHYFFEEIGFETPARFAFRLQAKMNLIMPYYNQLYNSQLAEIDPFLTKRYGYTSKDLLDKVGELTDGTNRTVDQVIEDIIHGYSEEHSKGSSTTNDTGNSNEDRNFTDTQSGTKSDGSEEEKINKTIVNYGKETTVNYNTQTTTTFNNVKNESTETGSIDHSDSVKNTRKERSVTSDTPEGLTKFSQIENELYANTATLSDITDTPSGKKTDTFNNHKNTNIKSGDQVDQKRGNDTTTDSGSDITDKSYRKEFVDNVNLTENHTGTGRNYHSNLLKGNTASDTNADNWQSDNKNDVLTEIINKVQNDIENSEKNSEYKTSGFDGTTMSEMLIKWRETFVNIDMMIINELADLFMVTLI